MAKIRHTAVAVKRAHCGERSDDVDTCVDTSFPGDEEKMAGSTCVSSSQEILKCFRSSWLSCWVLRVSWGGLPGRKSFPTKFYCLITTEPNYGIGSIIY